MSTEAPSVDRPQRGVSRRSFVTWSAALGGGGALVASNAQFLGMPAKDSVAAAVEGIPDAKTVSNVCFVNCGSRCPIRLQVKDGQIVRCLPDDTGDDTLENRQIRACLRGRSIRNRVYSPNRVKRPLKRREGTARGEGK